MSALAKTAVTTNAAYREGGMVGKRFVTKEVTLVLTGQGSTDNPIPASVFNFRKLLKASTFVESGDNNIIIASPSADKSMLLLADDASTQPGDWTGVTISGTVSGYPL